MNPKLVAAQVLCFFLGVPTLAGAQAGRPTTAQADPQAANFEAYFGTKLPAGRYEPLERRVFVDVKEAKPVEVLRQLAFWVNAQLVADPNLSTSPLTLRLWNARGRTALDAVCDTAGCVWRLENGQLRVSPGEPPPPVPVTAEFFARARRPLTGTSLQFNRAPLRTVLSVLSESVGARVAMEGVDPETPITLDLTGRTVFYATMKLSEMVGWVYQQTRIEGQDTPDSPVVVRLIGHTAAQAEAMNAAMLPVRIVEQDQPGLAVPRFASGTFPSSSPNSGRENPNPVVTLSCLVGANGDVETVKVVKAPDPRLGADAAAAVRDWQFVPGVKDGKPVPMRITLEVRFALK